MMLVDFLIGAAIVGFLLMVAAQIYIVITLHKKL